ncbi:hypothetical protein SNE40_009861 [Patella caerulea]|uniref:Uncharacterized protein n=1 Tax=Patella caerulea TaxID=87958 RepID=A0AAN8PT09_PATCE
MSFLKMFKKKSKDDEKKREEDEEQEKRRLRHSLSISRSGRFKQKKRERSGLLDKPELYDGPENEQPDNISPKAQTRNGHSTSPNNSCREASKPMQRVALGPSIIS